MLKNLLLLRWFHPLLLVLWIAIGAGLRLAQLAGKPPWTDEFATLVFSLGNSFQAVPLDKAMTLATLLAPLQPNPTADASTVIHYLLSEDHHPPLYFLLAHWWMQLFPTSGEYVSLWVARSLPAILGVVSIPAVYGLGWLAFRSKVVAQLAAAMMAVSPYGIFLAQEARHYTLGILWVIASLSCLVVATHYLQRQKPLPMQVVLAWVVINTLGMASHYFFSLTLCAEALVLFGFWLLGSGLAARLGTPKIFLNPGRVSNPSPVQSYWWRIIVAAVGTGVGCLVWLPVWQASHDTQMTQWIMSDQRSILSLINPIFQALATWITMLSLLPVEASSLPVVIASGAVMLAFFLWAIPILYRNFRALLQQGETRWVTSSLAGFVGGAIALFFSITYFLGIDLTRGARYNFVYFPAVMVLVGAILAVSWNSSASFDQHHLNSKPQNSKLIVAVILLMGLFSGITVISNLGYQKYYRPDLLAPAIQQTSSAPMLIATTHNTLVQTGEMMGLAWEFQRISEKSPITPQFLLAHQEQERCEGSGCPASAILQQTLAQLPRPLDLWLVNFKAPIEPDTPGCFTEDVSQYPTSVDGYTSVLYRCLALEPGVSQHYEPKALSTPVPN